MKFTKKDLSILVGNVLDHFDTALYSFLAPVLAPLFFPSYDPTVQLILAYSILATSMITRPIGTFIFGILAKNNGPIGPLSLSLIGMSVATLSIGLLPSFEVVGAWAPLGLILARGLRGIFAAGEGTIAKLYMMEEKCDQDALKSSHWYQSSVMLGTLLASLCATIVISLPSNDYGWRLCFGLAGTVGFMGFYLRYSLSNEEAQDESSFAQRAQISKDRHSIFETFWRYKYDIIRVALVTGFSYMTYAVPFVLMNSFVPLMTHLSLKEMMAFNTLLLIFDMLMIPWVGRLLIKVEGIKVMSFACGILMITIIPLFNNLPGASLAFVTFVRFWVVFWGIVFLCPADLWCKKLFTSSNQYLLVGMGNAIGTTTLGRLTPVICLWLWHTTQTPWLPGVYIALGIFATLAGLHSKMWVGDKTKLPLEVWDRQH